MKKILLVLFFILGSLSFARWELIEIKDEFGDEIIATSMGHVFYGPTPITFSTSGISIHENQTKYIAISPKKLVGLTLDGKTTVKFKIDDNKPIEFKGMISKNGETVYILQAHDKEKFDKLMSEMSNGNEFKVVIKDYADNNILEKGSLENFKECYPKVKGM